VTAVGALTEKQWQAQVVELAEHAGWTVHHTFDSRRSRAGWPDLTLLRAPHLVFVELKTETGRVSRHQQDTLTLLRACGQEAHVWRPSDLDEVLTRLGYRVASRARTS